MASSDHVNNDDSHEPIAVSSNEVSATNGTQDGRASYFTCSLFDTAKLKCLINGAVLASCTPSFEQSLYGSCEPPEERQVSPVSRDLTVPSKMACSVCVTDFSSRADQIQHYKLDWHRFNLKEKLKGNSPISEAAFDEQSGDISSLSGSDSESESRTSSDVSSSPRHKTRPSAVPEYLRATNETPGKLSENSSETDDADDVTPKRIRMQPKVYFQNDGGKVIGLYRCVIHSKKNSPATKEALVTMLNSIPEESNWAVILVGGGHFAAAVFERSIVLEHKTFHRYTVRAKQGSSQGARDGRQGGQHFNSAGSTLRRYNESALIKDIQDLLSIWSPRLQNCHRIFYRAPSFNRSILFGGKNPPFKKDDVRLRTIPFPTRRATYSEVRRVHYVLSTLECFGDSASFKESLPVSPKMHLGAKKKKTPPRPDDVVAVQDGSSNCSKDSPMSNSPRSVESKKEEESCVVDHDEDLTSSLRNELLPTEEQLEEPCPSPSTDPATAALNEADQPELNGCDENSVQDVHEMKVSAPPKRRKERRRASTFLKRQKDPDTDATAGEKYQMKNSLYDACKGGNLSEVQKLLDVIACSKEPLTLLNPENFSSSDMQSAGTQVVNVSAQTSLDFSVPLPNSTEPCPTTVEPSRKINAFVNVPSGHASRMSSVTNTSPSSHEEPPATTVQGRRHSSIECRDSSDIHSLTSDFDGCTLSDNSSATHARCCSLPSSPRAQQNKKQRSHSLSSKDDSVPTVLSASMLNEKINDEGTTLLHVATKEGHYGVVKALLDSGADPTIRNRKGLTPYMVSSDKEMRYVYRRFMASHPERYDYNEAQIPSPLTEAQEAEKLEKSKEKKKLKKAKMKEKKILAAELKKEEEEKQRFLNLSDREKRALAAERRYVQQFSGQPSQVKLPVLSRCFSCGVDITAKTPFEYLEYVFCSITCVKKHRAKASS